MTEIQEQAEVAKEMGDQQETEQGPGFIKKLIEKGQEKVAGKKEKMIARDAVLAKQCERSAEAFWESRGQEGSQVAAAWLAETEYLQAKNAGDPQAVEAAKKAVMNIGRGSKYAELFVNWAGDVYLGPPWGGDRNPETGVPYWAEKAMPVPAPVAEAPAVSVQ